MVELRTWALIGGLLLVGCQEKQASEGSAPPPIESSKPGACASGGGKVDDRKTAAFFPGVSGQYCVDPNNPSRSYGDAAQGTLDQACTELLDGECENYKQHGLKRVVMVRYIDGQGSPGAVNINLSEYATPEGAYGFFTKRVVGDEDPAEEAPKPLEAGGAGSIGSGIAYVWRGNYLAELSYTNELDSPDKLRENSAKILPMLASVLGEQIQGAKELPKAAARLPGQDQITLGTRYLLTDALGIAGTGAGAVGFYKRGDKRFRVVVLPATDEAGAKDRLGALKKLSGSKKLDGVGSEGVSFSWRDADQGPLLEGVAAVHGDSVLAVVDEPLALEADQAAEEAQKVKLSADEKLEQLKRSLGD
ncbi:MAG: hypothetical protein KIT72_10100 [Polyangiaceae bacterium]|nr:hypothetical protein [Polyangiaceae bacterium]MCW5790762.1 hypothetical protein [Polyangiaceae bacterium]